MYQFSQHVQNKYEWSINNHHNDLLAYYEPDCAENKRKAKFIKAGHNSYSRDVHELRIKDSVTGTMNKIQSFGPDLNSTYFRTSCNSSVFNTTESLKTLESTTEREISMDANLDKRFRTLTNHIVELQTNQINIRKERTYYLRNFTETVTELKQEVQNSTAKIKSERNDFGFAKLITDLMSLNLHYGQLVHNDEIND